MTKLHGGAERSIPIDELGGYWGSHAVSWNVLFLSEFLSSSAQLQHNVHVTVLKESSNRWESPACDPKLGNAGTKVVPP